MNRREDVSEDTHARRAILEKIVKQGNCNGVGCSKHCRTHKVFPTKEGNCRALRDGESDCHVRAAKIELEKLNREELCSSKEQAVNDFKSQQEIWKHLASGGKVQHKTIPAVIVGFNDGTLSDDMWDFGAPELWRKYTEPFKSSGEFFVLKQDKVHPRISGNPWDQLGIGAVSNSKINSKSIKVRISVEQIEEVDG
jgi:hypothetical protein